MMADRAPPLLKLRTYVPCLAKKNRCLRASRAKYTKKKKEKEKERVRLISASKNGMMVVFIYMLMEVDVQFFFFFNIKR